MNRPDAKTTDADMMRRCLALAKTSGDLGEYPYAAVICRNREFVCEATNRVARDGDVTRHAEVVALSEAQRILGQTSLDDCTIYAIAEPCAYCSYTIRETRIGRVVYGLRSPVMGGHSRWDVLSDTGLAASMPEVFAPPPEIVAGYMDQEAAEVFRTWNPLIWQFIAKRGIFVPGATWTEGPIRSGGVRRNGVWERFMKVFRRTVTDRIGRA
jgi:tRNA(adenine34) deaminase